MTKFKVQIKNDGVRTPSTSTFREHVTIEHESQSESSKLGIHRKPGKRTESERKVG